MQEEPLWGPQEGSEKRSPDFCTCEELDLEWKLKGWGFLWPPQRQQLMDSWDTNQGMFPPRAEEQG